MLYVMIGIPFPHPNGKYCPVITPVAVFLANFQFIQQTNHANVLVETKIVIVGICMSTLIPYLLHTYMKLLKPQQ